MIYCIIDNILRNVAALNLILPLVNPSSFSLPLLLINSSTKYWLIAYTDDMAIKRVRFFQSCANRQLTSADNLTIDVSIIITITTTIIIITKILSLLSFPYLATLKIEITS